MSTLEIRADIKNLSNSGNSCKKIYEQLRAKYGSACMSYKTVCRWKKMFAKGRTLLEDDPRCGRPPEFATERSIKDVRRAIERNPNVDLNMLLEATGKTEHCVQNILQNHLKMQRLYEKFVPAVLSDKQKQERLRVCQQLRDTYGMNWSELINDLIICDDTWIYLDDNHQFHDITAGHSQDNGSCSSSNSSGKKINSDGQHFPRRTMVTFFWDINGLQLFEYTPNGKPIESDQYCNLLQRVNAKLRAEKYANSKDPNIIFLHNQSLVHTGLAARTTLGSMGWKILQIPPNSPDMSPSDFYLFPDLKEHLQVLPIADLNSLQSILSTYFSSKTSVFFHEGLNLLKKNVEQIIDLQGHYLTHTHR